MISILKQFGENAFFHFWLPVLVWSLLCGWVMWLLKREANAHVRYMTQVALLLALPLGFGLSSLLDWQWAWQHWVLGDPQPQMVLPITNLPTQPVIMQDLPIALAVDAPTWQMQWWRAGSDWRFWLGWVTIVALAVSLWQGVLLLKAAMALRNMKPTLDTTPDVRLENALNAYFHLLPQRRNVQVATFLPLFPPFTFGWLRPIIAVPKSLLDEPQNLQLVIAHELTHVRRHDALWHLVAQTLRVVFAAHPLVRYLVRQIEFDREISCDAVVIAQHPTLRKQYATLLFEGLTSASNHSSLALTTSMASNPSHLKRRINAMNTPFQRPKWYTLGVLSSVVLALVMLTAVFANPRTKPVDILTTPIATETDALSRYPYPWRKQEFRRTYQIVEQIRQKIKQHYPEFELPAGIQHGDMFGGNSAAMFFDLPKVLHIHRGLNDDDQNNVVFMPLEIELSDAFDWQKIGLSEFKDVKFVIVPASSYVLLERWSEMSKPNGSNIEVPTLIGNKTDLLDQIRIPENIKKQGVDYVAFMELVIEENGSVSDVRSMIEKEDADNRLFAEVSRVLKMAQFVPFKRNGKAERIRYWMNIPFKYGNPEPMRIPSREAPSDTLRYGMYQGKKVTGVSIRYNASESEKVELTLENGQKVRMSLSQATQAKINLPPPPPPPPPPARRNVPNNLPTPTNGRVGADDSIRPASPNSPAVRNAPPPPPPPPPPARKNQKTDNDAEFIAGEWQERPSTRTAQAWTSIPKASTWTERPASAPRAVPTASVATTVSPASAPRNSSGQWTEVTEPVIYNFAEVTPQFVGGKDKLNAYLRDNLRYPEIARRAGIQGAVYVQFIVHEDGVISDPIVTRSIGANCDEEALRLVAAMPNWVPGKQNGQAVKVRLTLKVPFTL